MKKIILLFIVGVIFLVGYFVGSPYMTVSKIKTGIIQQDSEKLTKNIDFPLLRQHLKEQLGPQIMEKKSEELKENPSLAIKWIDELVETFVTPSGLASLMEGKKPQKESDSELRVPPWHTDMKPFSNAQYSFDSANQFSIWVPAESGADIQFVLTRSGLNWKLSNIVIPMDE